MKRVVFVLLLLSTSAWADWLRVGGSDQFDTYADPATIRRRGNFVKMWVLFDYKTAQRVVGAAAYLSTKLQDEYDCGEEQTRTLYLTAHSRNMGQGEIVTIVSEPIRWGPVSPGSVAETLWTFACKQ